MDVLNEVQVTLVDIQQEERQRSLACGRCTEPSTDDVGGHIAGRKENQP